MHGRVSLRMMVPYRFFLNPNARPRGSIQKKQNINTDPDDDSQLQSDEQARQEGGTRGYQINFWKQRRFTRERRWRRRLEKRTVRLTLRFPHGFHDVKFYHEDNGGDYHGCEGCFRDVEKVWGEELEREYDNHTWKTRSICICMIFFLRQSQDRTGVNPTERRPHAAGIVHGSSGQGSRHWHRTDEGRGYVAKTYRQHFLGCVYRFALRWKNSRQVYQ